MIGLAEQIVCDAGVAIAFGVGFTRTVAVIGVPGHPFAVGVMVKVTVTGAKVVLVNVPLISPEPLAAIPVTVAVLSLVQPYVVPVTLPFKTMVVIGTAEQTVWEAGVANAFGVGFTRTVARISDPGHPFAVGVIRKVTVIGIKVVLVSVPLISPDPLAAIPGTVAVLSLIQLNVVPVTLLLNTMVVIGMAEQTVWEDGVAIASGVGFTSTVAVIGVPGHPFAVGVIVNVTVTGAKVVLVSVPLILPVPLAAMPVTGTVLSLVQLNVVTAALLLNTIVVIGLAEQIVWEAGVANASGVGFTRTVALIGVPGHPFAVGVMVKVAVNGVNVVLVSVPLILPVPLAGIPVNGITLSLVQLKVVPVTLPLKTIVVIALPEQIVWDAGKADASGVGFTNTVAVIGDPVHPLAVGVMVNVTVTGAKVVLVSVPLILPLPLAGMPVTVAVLFLVQLNVAPPAVLVNTIVVIGAAEQTVCEAGVANASGRGLTVTALVIGVIVQPPTLV